MRSKSPVRKVRSELAKQTSPSQKRQKAVSNAVEMMERRLMMSSTITYNFGPAGTPTATPTGGSGTNFTGGAFTLGQSFGTISAPINTTSASTTYTGASGGENIGTAFDNTVAMETLTTSANPYYSVTLTPTASNKLEIDGFTFGSRSTGTGPTLAVLRSSIDGYTSNLESISLTGGTTWTLYSPTFTVATGTANSAVTLNLYLYGGNGAGNAASATENNRVDDVSISATAIAVVASVPTVTSVVPASGTINGANTVTINGTGFTGETGVTFGGTAATGVTFISDSQITATAPAHAAGQVDVIVTNATGPSVAASTDKYTYTAAPVVGSVVPVSGTTLGGATVSITGSGFTGVSAVKFGSVAATSYHFVSDTLITAVDPAESTGSVDVTVTTPSGTSATNGATVGGADTFTYVAPTTIVQAEALASGTAVTVTDNPIVTQIVSYPGTLHSVTYTNYGFIISDASGGSLEVLLPSTSTYVPTVGDTISVSGTYAPFHGIPEITSPTVTLISQNSSYVPPTAPVVTLTGTNGTDQNTLTTSTEGRLVTLQGVEVTGLSNADEQFEAANLTGTITDTSGNTETFYYYPTSFSTEVQLANGNNNIYFQPFPSGLVDITGLASVYTSGTTSTPEFIPLSISDSLVPPVVSSVTPNQGPPSGTTGGVANRVTITGYGFEGTQLGDGNIAAVSSVMFGGNASPGFTINSDNSITASVPAGSGTVDVEVTNGNGTSAAVTADKYTYTVAPVVTSITPDADLYSSTTTTVTINGLSFSGTPTVMFGTVAGTNVHVISGTQLTVTAPAVSGITANDPVDVTVTVSGNGTSTTNSSDTFTYAVAPTFSAIAPSTGGITGGTPVVITGANFLFNSTLNPNDTTVTFGGIAATSVTVNSATQITAVAPAGTTVAAVNIVVTTPGGSATSTSTTQFTYTQNNIATAEAATSGTTVTVNSNPVITQILSQPGTFDTVVYTKYAFLIQDMSGSLEVFSTLPSGSTYVPTVGDAIAVTGTYAPFDAIPEIGTVTAISLISSHNTALGPASPVVKTVPQVNQTTLNISPGGVGEYLVTLDDVTITGAYTGTAPGTSVTSFGAVNITATITDSSGNALELYYYVTSYSTPNTALAGTTIPTGPVNITGFADVFGTGSSAIAEFDPTAITPYVASSAPAWLSTGSVYSNYTPGAGTAGGTITISSGTIIADPTASGDGGINVIMAESGGTPGTLNTALPAAGTTTIHFGTLNIGAGETLSLASTTTIKPILFTTGSALTIASTGSLQLASGYLDLVGGADTLANTDVRLGFDKGLFDGAGGIDDNLAGGDTSHLTSPGVRTVTAAGTLDGGAYAIGDTLVRTTYFGDADLSLAVDATDYSRIDNAFAHGGGAGYSGWFNGDFNYDGVINGSDYTLIDNAFNSQGHGPVTPTAVVATPAAAYAVAPVATPDASVFSDKKVKESLADEVDDLITG